MSGVATSYVATGSSLVDFNRLYARLTLKRLGEDHRGKYWSDEVIKIIRGEYSAHAVLRRRWSGQVR